MVGKKRIAVFTFVFVFLFAFYFLLSPFSLSKNSTNESSGVFEGGGEETETGEGKKGKKLLFYKEKTKPLGRYRGEERNRVLINGKDEGREVAEKTSWGELAEYDFKFKGKSSFPMTESVIIQVVIIGKKNWWSPVIYSNVEAMTEPLCRSSKNWNVGLITLLSYNGTLPTCESWYNGIVIHFDSILTEMFSLHDERLFVTEQFIRQFKLWKIYK